MAHQQMIVGGKYRWYPPYSPTNLSEWELNSPLASN